MLDVARLRNTIKQRGLTINMVASSIGVNKSIFYRKLKNGGDNFTISEMNAIIKHLGIAKNDVIEIFMFMQAQ